MVVQIIADTGCDIPEEIIKKLNISLVPFLVQWKDGEGFHDFRDGIEIRPDKIYNLLKAGVDLKTSAPVLGDYINLYQKYDEIVSIHVSQKLSKAFEAALVAKAITEEKKNCKIEVIDSEAIGMGLGFLVILAAQLVQKGIGINEIIRIINNAIPRIHTLGILGTTKHILRGGRFSVKEGSLVANMVKKIESSTSLKLTLILKDGKLIPSLPLPAIKTENIEKKLISFAKEFSAVESVAVEYTVLEDEESAHRIKFGIKELFPLANFYISRIGAGLAVHGGQGTLMVSVLEKGEVEEDEKEYLAKKLSFA